MSSEVQPDRDPAAELLAAARAAVPGWLRRVTSEAAGDVGHGRFAAELDEMVAAGSERLIHDLERLLGTDVDEQSTNPLTLFRSAVAPATELLDAYGVPARPADAFAAERFPDDPYQLGPATWSDIDPSMHEPGLIWGAWKAMTVMQRRRDEGLR